MGAVLAGAPRWRMLPPRPFFGLAFRLDDVEDAERDAVRRGCPKCGQAGASECVVVLDKWNPVSAGRGSVERYSPMPSSPNEPVPDAKPRLNTTETRLAAAVEPAPGQHIVDIALGQEHRQIRFRLCPQARWDGQCCSQSASVGASCSRQHLAAVRAQMEPSGWRNGGECLPWTYAESPAQTPKLAKKPAMPYNNRCVPPPRGRSILVGYPVPKAGLKIRRGPEPELAPIGLVAPSSRSIWGEGEKGTLQWHAGE